MPPNTFEIDGRNFDDFAGFVVEFNRGFVSHVGGKWHGNLDAFNDYLSWVEIPYELHWRNSAKSCADLDHSAVAEWLAGNLLRCHPDNRLSVQTRLDRAKQKEGPTLFDWLVEIIHENQEFVQLILE